MAQEMKAVVPEVPRTVTSKNQQKLVALLSESEVNRRIEVSFLDNALNFSALTRYSARIRYIDDDVFYVVVLPSDELEKTPSSNALKDKEVKIHSLDQSFADGVELIDPYFYNAEIGHVLGFLNLVMKLSVRSSLRVPINEKMYISIMDDSSRRRRRKREEIEVGTLDLSSSGIAVSCPRGSGVNRETLLELKVPLRSFPGYDASQGGAILNGTVTRVFPNDERPNWVNLGVQFEYEDSFSQFQINNQISSFCARLSFTSHQNTVEAELDAKYGSAFTKKKKKFRRL